MAKNGLGVKRLTRAHFAAGAETIAQIVLNGCGIRLCGASSERRLSDRRVRAVC